MVGCQKTSGTLDEENTSSEKLPEQSELVENTVSGKAITGEKTGTDKTYTGFEPLPAVHFDIDKTVRLKNDCIGYSYGVSKNGVPHENSLNAQKTFEKFGAIAIDTVCQTKNLYLTFDCGYENGYTSKILDTLKEKNVPAAFFCTFDFIKDNPDLVTRMILEGHIVGNHSTTHPSFPSLTREGMASEIEKTDNYLREHFGYSAPYFRFPKGEYSENALDLVSSIGYQSVFWSVAYADWDTSVIKGKEYATKTVTDRLHQGAIILLHSVSPDNAAAMGDIIDKARSDGYEFCSL